VTVVETDAARPALRGHYAGFVSRFVAFLLDIGIIAITFAIGGRVVEFVFSVIGGHRFSLSDAAVTSRTVLIVWVFVYSSYCLAAAGHTPGMAMLGIRAVRRDGTPLRTGQAILRVLVMPLSFSLLGLGFLLILLRRDRRALQDLIARTAVVYAWDAHGTHMRFLARPHPGPTAPISGSKP